MELIVVLLALVGAVWGGLLLWRGGLAVGVLLLLLAGICFGMPMSKWQLGPLPLTTDRLLLPLVAVQYLIWRRWGWTNRTPLTRTEWLAAALVAVLSASTFSADWSREGYQPVAWLVLSYLMPATVYWIARETPWEGPTPKRVLVCVSVFSVYLAITTIAEQRQWWPIVFPRYIAETARESGEWIGRGRGPLLHPIGNGLLLSIGLAALLCAWPHAGRGGKAAVAAASALVLAAVAATLTRSVWLGAAGGLVVVGALVVPRRARLPLLGGGMLAGALVLGVFWDQVMNYKRERHLSAAAAAESAQLRPILAAIAWEMFCDRPLLGCGYAQYSREHLQYTADRDGELPLEKGRGYVAHNVFLSLLTETGLVGLGLFTALLAGWAVQAWRLWHQTTAPLAARQMGLVFLATLTAYVVNGLFHDVALVAMANQSLFAVAGAMTAAAVAARSGRNACARDSAKADDGQCAEHSDAGLPQRLGRDQAAEDRPPIAPPPVQPPEAVVASTSSCSEPFVATHWPE